MCLETEASNIRLKPVKNWYTDVVEHVAFLFNDCVSHRGGTDSIMHQSRTPICTSIDDREREKARGVVKALFRLKIENAFVLALAHRIDWEPRGGFAYGLAPSRDGADFAGRLTRISRLLCSIRSALRRYSALRRRRPPTAL